MRELPPWGIGHAKCTYPRVERSGHTTQHSAGLAPVKGGPSQLPYVHIDV